jgi:vitamin B12 transporter
MPDTIFTFPSTTTTLNAYTLLGGIVSYDTTPWSTVYVRAENVFNQRYEEVYSYRSPGAGVYAGLKVRTNQPNLRSWRAISAILREVVQVRSIG